MLYLFLHILFHGYNLKQLGGDEVTVQHSFFLYGFLLTLFVPATYCFVFISGYYGITFKLKKLLSLLLGCFIKQYALALHLRLQNSWKAYCPFQLTNGGL